MQDPSNLHEASIGSKKIPDVDDFPPATANLRGARSTIAPSAVGDPVRRRDKRSVAPAQSSGRALATCLASAELLPDQGGAAGNAAPAPEPRAGAPLRIMSANTTSGKSHSYDPGEGSASSKASSPMSS